MLILLDKLRRQQKGYTHVPYLGSEPTASIILDRSNQAAMNNLHVVSLLDTLHNSVACMHTFLASETLAPGLLSPGYHEQQYYTKLHCPDIFRIQTFSCCYLCSALLTIYKICIASTESSLLVTIQTHVLLPICCSEMNSSVWLIHY